MNMFIRKSVIEDKTLSDEAFTVFCALRSIMTSEIYYFVSYNMIAYTLYMGKCTRYELEAIKKGFNELVERNYITIEDTFSKSEFSVDLRIMQYDKDQHGYFSDIRKSEMQVIMQITTSVSKYKLFRYYTCMVGTFNRSKNLEAKYRGKIGGLSMDCFTELLGISKSTISTYNKILEDNRILYIVRNDYVRTINKNGISEVKELPNTYSRFEDKDIADSFCNRKRNTEVKQNLSNVKRGIAIKYNHFCKGKEYDINTICAMYEYCIEYNNNSGQEKKRDMSIFANYLDDIKRIKEGNEKPQEIAAFSIGE